jgi:hypothetical protein
MPSKSVGGRKPAGGFDSRPPPLPNAPSDQRRSAEPGHRRPREGPDPSPNDRVHHTSLSVSPPPGAGQVFRPPAGGPDKSSDSVLSKERRKRHGPPRWTTDSEESRWRISARSSSRTARPGTSPARPSSGTTTAHDGSPTGARPRGSGPLRTFAGPTSSTSHVGEDCGERNHLLFLLSHVPRREEASTRWG